MGLGALLRIDYGWNAWQCLLSVEGIEKVYCYDSGTVTFFFVLKWLVLYSIVYDDHLDSALTICE